jgi:long-chain acyl-CoA synthetase
MARAALPVLKASASDLRHLRILWLSGETLPPTTLERLQAAMPATLIRNVYGLTEAGHTIFINTPRHGAMGVIANSELVGRSIRVDTPGLRPGESGLVGPIMVRKRSTALDSRSEGTLDDAWIETGDLGFTDFTGAVHFLSRVRDIVVVDGRKIGTAEVEDALRFHTDVADAAVVAMPNPTTGERVLAVIVVRGPVSDDDLRRFLISRLPRAAIPAVFVRCAALPKTPSGKTDRQALRNSLLGPINVDTSTRERATP